MLTPGEITCLNKCSPLVNHNELPWIMTVNDTFFSSTFRSCHTTTIMLPRQARDKQTQQGEFTLKVKYGFCRARKQSEQAMSYSERRASLGASIRPGADTAPLRSSFLLLFSVSLNLFLECVCPEPVLANETFQHTLD